MQWSQIKTLFILCFLILDIYLLVQFLNKQDDSDYAMLDEQQQSIEDQLSSENIKLPDLPEKQLEGSYISVKRMSFSESEMDTLNAFANQNATLVTDKLIISQFKEPVAIPDEESAEKIVKENIIYPDDYWLWSWNKQLNVMIFFHEKNDQPIYFNQSGLLLVFLNDKNEIMFYAQTMLGNEVENFDDKKQLIKPITAIYTLYNQHELFTGEEITDTKVGYFAPLPDQNDELIFAPTWKITVNNERNYFVNAIEGFVFASSDVDFLEDAMNTIMEKVSSMEDNKKFKEAVLGGLKQRLEAINRSEEQ